MTDSRNGISEFLEVEPQAVANIPSDRLEWSNASDEQIAFMKRVYDINLQRLVSGGRRFVADIPESELEIIENGLKATRPSARACRRLLSKVRNDIGEQNVQVSIGLTSAYRSASHQFRLWQRYFPDYYERTSKQRRKIEGGEHSETAAQLLASFVRQRIGVPGYSLHNIGLAVDFLNKENNKTMPNKTTQEAIGEWKTSWFWRWMIDNANQFGFFQNLNINEPWHWEYKNVVTTDEVRNSEIFNSFESGGGTFKRLKEEKVKYLAFEGGGGKGFVFVGAIKALQEKGILRFANGRLDPTGPIRGISGASAGAITAMLLSIGYNAEAIQKLLETNNFNKFFDLPDIPSQIPKLKGCGSVNNNLIINMLQQLLRAFTSVFIPNPFGARDIFNKAIDNGLKKFFKSRIDLGDINDGPFPKLAKYPFHYLNDIIVDLGIFSGCNARNFIDNIVKQKTGRSNTTFLQHFQIFGIELVLTGTNLERGTSEFFSKDTTPNMPIADAVRISMGLPFIFKPYRISVNEASQMGNAALSGLWVDGGVRNNLPIRAFENKTDEKPNTFGIRLEVEKESKIDNIIDMLIVLTLKQGLFGSGEAHISSTSGYKQQTIILSTQGLSLTNFNPPAKIVEPLIREARTSVFRYFDQRIPLPEFIDK